LIDKLQPPTTTFLKPNHYQTLFVEYGRSNWCHRETYTYRLGTPTKQVWSITPNFPDNLHIRPGITQELAPLKLFVSLITFFFIIFSIKKPQMRQLQITGLKRHAMMFTTIVRDTKAVAIGPLEYCGNAKVIQLPHRKAM
jgi:hypothetical protein